MNILCVIPEHACNSVSDEKFACLYVASDYINVGKAFEIGV
jgi:hypothetical protein